MREMIFRIECRIVVSFFLVTFNLHVGRSESTSSVIELYFGFAVAMATFSVFAFRYFCVNGDC